MKKLAFVVLAVLAMASFSAPTFADPGNQGNNPHAHKGGTKTDPQPDHGKDNCNACVG